MNPLDLLQAEDLFAVWPQEIYAEKDFYNPALLFAAVTKLYGETSYTNAAGRGFTAKLFLSLRQEFNGYATKVEDIHFIGITYKQALFNRIVAESALFWETLFFDIKTPSDVAAEKARLLEMREQARKIISFSGGLIARFEKAYANGDLVPMLNLYDPHDQKRRLAAWYIAQASVLLALRHELAHAVNGHCSWLGRADATRRLCICNEMRPYDVSLEADTLRGLELEADFSAAALCLFDILQGNDPLDTVLRTEFDVETRIALLTFATCSLALVWQSETRKELDDHVHPPPLTRAYSFLNGFYAVAERVQLNNVKELVGRGVKRGLENVFVYSQINPDYLELGRVVDDAIFRQEYGKIIAHPLDMLEPYAYRNRSSPPVIGEL